MRYEGSSFPERVMEINDGGIVVNAMQKCKSTSWKWPTLPNSLMYLSDEAMEKVSSDCIIPYDDRGVFEIKSEILSMW